MIGKTISHYQIIEELGRGGMGLVYKAEDSKLKRTVALKFLPPELTHNQESKERFIREAHAASALEHDNICTIHEIDETDDCQLFIVMACYEGKTLKKIISDQQLSIDQAIDIVTQLAKGLQKAHDKGIVHRDIKPANILITDDGSVKILDFGLAKLAGKSQLTKDGSTLGTVAYMSPEQLRGEEVDHRTDIWSLGVVIYEMLTGDLPFKGDYEQAITYSILNDEPLLSDTLNSGISDKLIELTFGCLQKNPKDRYKTIQQFLEKLVNSQKEYIIQKSSEKGLLNKKNITLAAILIVFLLFTSIFILDQSGDKKVYDSIAVLPLKNLSGNPDQEYFSDGMTEALITELSKIKSLKVISRTSIMQFKNTDKTLPEITDELNVSVLVEGSALIIGDQVKITAQLIDAEKDQHLWAEDYVRDLQNILSLHKEVANTIALQVKTTLSPEEKLDISGAKKVNPKAYELYLRGRFFMNKYTKEGFTQAFDYFQQAIEKESNFSLAYVGLAETYIYLEDIGAKRPREAYPLARKAVNRAIEINDKLAEAHTCLAQIKFWFDWDWLGAEYELKRAIELNPGNSESYIIYAQLFRVRRKLDKELKTIRRAWELNPLGLYVNLVLGTSLFNIGEYDKAIEQFKKIIELDPNYALAYWGLGLVYATKGFMTESITAFQKAIDLSPGDVHHYGDLAYAFTLAGKRSEALQILHKLKEQSKETYVPAFVIARIYEGLGDTDSAFEWLDKAYDERSSWIPFINSMHFFDSLRGDSRFADLLKKIGLEK